MKPRTLKRIPTTTIKLASYGITVCPCGKLCSVEFPCHIMVTLPSRLNYPNYQPQQKLKTA